MNNILHWTNIYPIMRFFDLKNKYELLMVCVKKTLHKNGFYFKVYETRIIILRSLFVFLI